MFYRSNAGVGYSGGHLSGGLPAFAVDNQMELAQTHSGPVATELNWNKADHLPEFKKMWNSCEKSTLKNKYSGNRMRVKTNSKEKKQSCKQYLKGV